MHSRVNELAPLLLRVLIYAAVERLYNGAQVAALLPSVEYGEAEKLAVRASRRP
ncbi:hypothetical protein PR003_g12397 [Phytophthora rubi]|uniref:Uncharacterized protein n=1 Tax=Phytophthora rubi TaxID=129364 RepID=A0A6A4F8I8_9STRA|nr:hypothetical protein PR003_g12397 [Phytophthora rubi]